MEKNCFGHNLQPMSEFLREAASTLERYESGALDYETTNKTLWLLCGQAYCNTDKAVVQYEIMQVRGTFLHKKIQEVWETEGKIPAIKEHRSLTGSGLKESKDKCERWANTFGWKLAD